MLDRQINLFKIDTSAFLWEDEKKYKNEFDSIVQVYNDIKKKYKKDESLLSIAKTDLNKWRKETTNKINELSHGYVEYNKNHQDKKIRNIDKNVLTYIDKNTNEENIRVKKIISMFESTLTRSFGIQTNELTEDIFIVEIFYYDIAQDIILNGFNYNGKHYVYFSSSAGQIRTKKAVFVNEEKLKKCEPKLMCGLSRDRINELGGMNVNKYLAYLALVNSATDLWEDVLGKPFNIDECIVVDDFETLVHGKVDYINVDTYEITPGVEKDEPIPHTDGCGMISSDYCSKNFMVRLPFVKGLLGSFDFKKFIVNNNYSPVVKDIWGKEYDVIKDNINIIFTKSQLKMYKFYSSWDEYKDNFKKYGCEAGICNFEEDKIPNAQINYQMMQTLYDATDKEIEELCEPANNRISSLSDSVENMLWFFHAEDNDLESRIINPTWFEKSLKIYPELLTDPATIQDLKDCKKSYIKKYRSAKLDVRGKFTFVLPDLYAFCEWLFGKIEHPLGLLEDGEVFCKLYKTSDKLDCLRSPHLYIEHAIRKNVCNKKYRNQRLENWFCTDAIYTSTHDFISRILQFDVDGDRLLVIAQKNIIAMAERITKDVYPLYYEMGKASAVQIDQQQIYKGLIDAFKGGKIGAISNDITKIWNSGQITDEQKMVIKWLCMETNFNIDYAKTLYKPERPEYAEKLIKKYTKAKVPHFFIDAKNKKKSQCEPISKSKDDINIIDNISKHIKENRNMFKLVENLDNVDYLMLLKNKEDLGINNELNKVFDRHNKHYGYNIRIDDRDKRNNNINEICKQVLKDLFIIEPNRDKIICSIARFLYEHKTTRKKKLFWTLFGEEIYNNLKDNLKDLPKNICMQCGKRTDEKLINKKCFDCRQKEVKEKNGMKEITCVDCGKKILVKSNARTHRCDECKHNKQIEYMRLNRKNKNESS